MIKNSFYDISVSNGQRKEFVESNRAAVITKEGRRAYEVRSRREDIEDEIALNNLLSDFH